MVRLRVSTDAPRLHQCHRVRIPRCDGLRHRPGRLWMGAESVGPLRKPDEQVRTALVLSSLARITSSFPAAFPPFRASQVKELATQQYEDGDRLLQCESVIRYMSNSSTMMTAATTPSRIMERLKERRRMLVSLKTSRPVSFLQIRVHQLRYPLDPLKPSFSTG